MVSLDTGAVEARAKSRVVDKESALKLERACESCREPLR